jgi:Golgi nucleoside diphosphatase
MAGGAVVKTQRDKQDFDTCKRFVSETLFKKDDGSCPRKPCAIGKVFQPSLTESFSGPIYAFSYFYDRMEAKLPEDGKIVVGDYKRIGKDICNSRDEKTNEKNKGTMCLDFAFLYAILSDGYALPDTQTLYVKKKVKNIETAWPLGATLAEMQF